MMIWWVMLSIIITPFVYYLYLHLSAKKIENYVNPTQTFDEISKTLKTGDLVFLSGHHPGERVCKALSNSVFSHVGMVVVENDIIYILDCDVGQGYKDGVRLMELEKKLERYKGSKIGGIRRIRVELRLEKVLDQVEKYKDVVLDDNMWTWCVSSFPSILKLAKDEKNMFCSEFVAVLLMEHNLLSNSKHSTYYTPEILSKMENEAFDDKMIYFKW